MSYHHTPFIRTCFYTITCTLDPPDPRNMKLLTFVEILLGRIHTYTGISLLHVPFDSVDVLVDGYIPINLLLNVAIFWTRTMCYSRPSCII